MRLLLWFDHCLTQEAELKFVPQSESDLLPITSRSVEHSDLEFRQALIHQTKQKSVVHMGLQYYLGRTFVL